MKEFFIIMGLFILLVNSAFFSQALLTAYFSEDKTVSIAIDNYGEAHLEFILYIITTPISLIGAYLILKNRKKIT
jgi:uncharacterized membrane protein YvlD (DUF360 family)